MGALHRGHAMLLAYARELAGKRGTVVASIFVNPTQFGPGEDFARYPRNLNEDLKICRQQKVDAVFLPQANDLYEKDHSVFVGESDLSASLCGANRPGHFQGVCTVVAKLFHIVQPDLAVFGEKDWQQLAVIRRMVRDLFFRVQILGYPIVRESDGLAMSSRNQYLSPEERESATAIFLALRKTAQKLQAGEASVTKLRRFLRSAIQKIPGAIPEYAEIVHPENLHPLKGRVRETACALVAVRMGKARLIDNHLLTPAA